MSKAEILEELEHRLESANVSVENSCDVDHLYHVGRRDALRQIKRYLCGTEGLLKLSDVAQGISTEAMMQHLKNCPEGTKQ